MPSVDNPAADAAAAAAFDPSAIVENGGAHDLTPVDLPSPPSGELAQQTAPASVENEGNEEEDEDGDEVMIASDLALSPDIDKDGNIISCTDDDLDDIENKKTNSNVLSLRKRRKRMRYSYSKLARTVLKWPAGHNIISSDLYAIHSTGFRSPCVIRQSSPSTPRSLGIR